MKSLELKHKAPRIALVIGSGGVRSASAIGVMRVLQREGLAPQLLVGCSSGALIAGVLALGVSVAEATHMVTSAWSQELTQQRRWRAWLELALPRLLHFGPHFALRKATLIRQRLDEAFGRQHIETLPLALRVTATDAASGQAVVLGSGPLAQAIQASMAVPMVFPPVQVGPRLLLDGVLSDPLPVSAAADADLVLALGFEGRLPRRVNHPARLVTRISTTMINNLMAARLDAARRNGPPILQLQLALQGPVGLWQTSALPAMVEAGAQAMQQALPELRRQLARPAQPSPLAAVAAAA
ncbi:patatin-like phospholipase family protein [Aquabacterium sp. OR-4]|uniref:patatin-like phospholipase family protein n=1 Tax=Aquabacterium sp. OR-4 TaxID=2978127 RepID=UPI0021B25769|nr:patatin-like phospholipase family protein [Aquabacterium sp. OR-4]MDT7838000.1 patatin-like phospholipase family protein [Aquabacterium sp. OR-4]